MRPGAPPPPPQGESARPPRALWSWVRGREPASGAETWTWRLRGGGVALPMETATLAWPRPKRGWGAEALSPNRAVKVSPSGRFLSFAFPPLLFRVQWLRALVAEGGGGAALLHRLRPGRPRPPAHDGATPPLDPHRADPRPLPPPTDGPFSFGFGCSQRTFLSAASAAAAARAVSRRPTNLRTSSRKMTGREKSSTSCHSSQESGVIENTSAMLGT